MAAHSRKPNVSISRLSIRVRTLLACAVLAVVVLATGVLSLVDMNALRRATATFRAVTLTDIAGLDRLTVLVQDYRLVEGQLLDAPDPKAKSAATARLTALDADIAAARRHLATPALRQRFDPLWAAYRADGASLAALQQNADPDTVAAYFWGTMQSAYDRLRTSLTDAMDASRRGGSLIAAHANRTFVAATWQIASGLAVCLALCGAVALILAVTVTAPLASLSAAMRRLAARDMAVEIAGTSRADELGVAARALSHFRDSLLHETALAEQATADDRARHERSQALRADVAAFEQEVASRIERLSAASSRMIAIAEAMSVAARQTDGEAAEIVSTATEADGSVASVAASAEELSASVAEIGRQVTQSVRVADQGASAAERSGAIIARLAESAGRIGEVVDLITRVTSQTNLLALNATIEAARAGDAGRGFAVVASEVKNLAGQTAGAAAEIAGRVTEVRAAVAEAVGAMEAIGAVIQEVSGVSSAIAAAVEQQGAATAEIARNAQFTAASTHEITTHIALVSRAATDTGNAAATVLEAANDVSREAGDLSGGIASFLATVRSA